MSSQVVVRLGIASLLVSGCGSSDPPADGASSGEPVACAVGDLRREDGVCVTPGVPADLACPPGEVEAAPASCIPAGVAPDACAVGFKHADSGCEAAFPACAPGSMAVPGDGACREVMTCGAGTWGDLETDAATQHVDGAYAGADSDGTSARPWRTIQEAVDAAADDGRVVVAAGTYAENVLVDGAVQLWGRCPSLVRVVGPSTNATVKLAGADGATIGGLAIEGSGPGLGVSGGTVTLDRLWIHDTAEQGLIVVGDLGATHATLSGSLIEAARDVGAFVEDASLVARASLIRGIEAPDDGSAAAGLSVQTTASAPPAALELDGCVVEGCAGFGLLAHGAMVTMSGSMVRGSVPLPDGAFGRGVDVSSALDHQRSTLTIHGSVISDNMQAGLRVTGSDASITATVVRDTQPGADGALGRGIDLLVSDAGPAKVSISGSLVSGNHDSGVLATASELTLSATRVRDTLAATDWGGGVQVQSLDGVRGSAAITSCVIERSVGLGVHAVGSTLLLEGSVVRDTALYIDDARGVMVANDQVGGQRASATLRTSLLERNAVAGLHVIASDAVVVGVTVRDTAPGPTGEARGIGAEADIALGVRASLTARSLLVEGSSGMGAYVGGADVTLEATAIRGTAARADGTFGDGIAVVGSAKIPSVLTMTNTRVAESARAGLSNFGSTVVFGSNELACSGFDIEGEAFEGAAFSFEHRGGNVCGCPASAECQVLSSGLAAPAPLPPTVAAP